MSTMTNGTAQENKHKTIKISQVRVIQKAMNVASAQGISVAWRDTLVLTVPC